MRRDGRPATYSRKGKVLSFFNKPDVAYYGGDFDERITVYTSNGEDYVYGTSFAAPWISRKLSYLIDIIGLPREVAKALIIDSAAGWDYKLGTYKIKDEEGLHADERQSRKEFRKWENTKFISKILKDNRPIKSYGERLWGISVTSKERLTSLTMKNLNFGAVITLREVNGINRIQDFIRACTLRGWIVNEINVQNQLQVYNTSHEEIIFD